MNTFLSIVSLILLYTILWFKGNAKPIFNINVSPWQWWLYTSLITNYLGLIAWWQLVQNYNIWIATSITYALHTIIEISLSAYFCSPPSQYQMLGIVLIIIGTFISFK